jgi:hypothetical protein
VKVGFNAIARAAKTIVSESFLVSMIIPRLLFHNVVTYLSVTTQKWVKELG